MHKQNLFDDETVALVRANIFPPAQEAIQDWHNFPWHTGPKGNCDTGQTNSSQALAVDVFGTLKTSGQRDAILNAVAHQIGLPPGKDWEVELEYLDELNLLQERRLTQVDAVARCDSSLIFFECKFTEKDGGACRQTLPVMSGRNLGKVQCNGAYRAQINPVNNVAAPCALTGKGIRYWDVIPNVFHLQNDQDYDPCPFRFSKYQWMRNLTNCYALAKHFNLAAGFVVVYADAPFLPMPQKIQSQEWVDLVRCVQTDRIAFHALSYQALVQLAGGVDCEHLEVWDSLRRWIEEKIMALPRDGQS